MKPCKNIRNLTDKSTVFCIQDKGTAFIFLFLFFSFYASLLDTMLFDE